MNTSDMMNIKSIASSFLNPDKILKIEEIDSGHINTTYKVVMPEANYILQKINSNVFPSPYGVMHNIRAITDHIRKKVIYEGKNPNLAVLNIVQSKYGQDLFLRDGEYWRCMQYISGASTHEVCTTDEMFGEIGKAIGDFQFLLDGFHSSILDETIRHFHDTPYRYKHFLDMVKLDNNDRVKNCKPEVDYIKNSKDKMNWITSRLEDRTLKSRVAHNDTKPSNVMIDDKTGKYVCLIDLDTVMRGSVLYDFGDAIRIGACTTKEDEVDYEKTKVDLNRIRVFTKEFLKSMKSVITPLEVKGLYNSCFIIALELGMRFLDDYLNGDVYFKISHPDHNLERARNQLQFSKELEKNKDNINKIITELLSELEYGPEFNMNEE